MSLVRVLVTGFEPFGGASINPAQSIVDRLIDVELPGIELHRRVLPVEFGRSAKLLTDAIDEIGPNVVIALGQAEGRTKITPERVAINVDDARIPDNADVSRVDTPINLDGPAAYFSTLPIKAIVEALNTNSIPAAISTTAGTFVCNHVFYAMQHHLRNTDIRSGFIHVPLQAEQTPEFPELPTLALDELVRGIATAIRVCA